MQNSLKSTDQEALFVLSCSPDWGQCSVGCTVRSTALGKKQTVESYEDCTNFKRESRFLVKVDWS